MSILTYLALRVFAQTFGAPSLFIDEAKAFDSVERCQDEQRVSLKNGGTSALTGPLASGMLRESRASALLGGRTTESVNQLIKHDRIAR